MFLYANGEFINSSNLLISSQNRGLRLGDGIFETIRIHNAQIFQEEFVWSKILKSCNILDIDINISKSRNIIQKILEQEKICYGVLRITIARIANSQGYGYNHECKSSYEFIVERIENFEEIVYFSLSVTQNLNISSICHYPKYGLHSKTLSSLEYVRRYQETMKMKCHDALIVDQNKKIFETNRANIFCIDNQAETIYTPKNFDIISGTIRHVILETVQDFKIIETDLFLEDLQKFTTIFTTNIRSICPIGKIYNPLKEEFWTTSDSYSCDILCHVLEKINNRLLENS